MKTAYFQKLFEEDCISAASLKKIKENENTALFSLHWEIKTVLYLGVVLLSTGLGILIYKNIDTIGHQVILLLIASISAGSFYYCFKHKSPFNRGLVKPPTAFFDYILLLGCLSFLIFLGYLQFQYGVFGQNYRLATLIPMLLLFYVAYAFDHLGILGMGITNLAVWLGVTVTPKELLRSVDFDQETVVFTYLFLGLLLLVAAFLSSHFDFKKHFKFTYQHFGIHLSFISLLSGYFIYIDSVFCFLFLLVFFGLAFLLYKDSLAHQSFYFLVLAVLYSYIALSCLIVRLLLESQDSFFLFLLYFIGSGVGVLRLLMILNKKVNAQ